MVIHPGRPRIEAVDVEQIDRKGAGGGERGGGMTRPLLDPCPQHAHTLNGQEIIALDQDSVSLQKSHGIIVLNIFILVPLISVTQY